MIMWFFGKQNNEQQKKIKHLKCVIATIQPILLWHTKQSQDLHVDVNTHTSCSQLSHYTFYAEEQINTIYNDHLFGFCVIFFALFGQTEMFLYFFIFIHFLCHTRAHFSNIAKAMLLVQREPRFLNVFNQ